MSAAHGEAKTKEIVTKRYDLFNSRDKTLQAAMEEAGVHTSHYLVAVKGTQKGIANGQRVSTQHIYAPPTDFIFSVGATLKVSHLYLVVAPKKLAAAGKDVAFYILGGAVWYSKLTPAATWPALAKKNSLFSDFPKRTTTDESFNNQFFKIAQIVTQGEKAPKVTPNQKNWSALTDVVPNAVYVVDDAHSLYVHLFNKVGDNNIPFSKAAPAIGNLRSVIKNVRIALQGMVSLTLPSNYSVSIDVAEPRYSPNEKKWVWGVAEQTKKAQNQSIPVGGKGGVQALSISVSCTQTITPKAKKWLTDITSIKLGDGGDEVDKEEFQTFLASCYPPTASGLIKFYNNLSRNKNEKAKVKKEIKSLVRVGNEVSFNVANVPKECRSEEHTCTIPAQRGQKKSKEPKYKKHLPSS
eukprot:GHVT01063578.1.p1 GENE.GHVT01063578.1~~GHVT01063578.1.p1  ORF type:complete len:426 (+),score=45.57 GHVT01063578.1:53-1279(+)